MVLDGGNGKSVFCQDFLRSLDFSKVMIGNADFPDLSALGERNEVLRPAFDVHRVVDPVDIHVVRVKTGEASLQHLFHGVIPGACNLRGEFRGNEDIFSWHILHEIAQDSFGRSFSVVGCCVPEGQSFSMALSKRDGGRPRSSDFRKPGLRQRCRCPRTMRPVRGAVISFLSCRSPSIFYLGLYSTHFREIFKILFNYP